MHIHEYQAKEELRKIGIAVPNGVAIENQKDIESIINNKVSNFPVVVKAQVLSGGRGKAGGIKMAENKQQALEIANKMLGSSIVTEQSNGAIQVNKIYLEEAIPQIKREIYLAATIDTNQARIIFMAAVGGVDIESTAFNSPEKVIKIEINMSIGVLLLHAQKIAYKLSMDKTMVPKLFILMQKIYNYFLEKNLMQLEINPLVINHNNDLVALDAKIEFDDNALYKHKDINDLFDSDTLNPLDLKAKELDISYIKMNGNIACMVNGAGLAMATMDMIKLHGGEPANFLDVGGGASIDKIENACDIILQDSNVKGLLVNIFGGIVRCDLIARGLHKFSNTNIPIVLRLSGTNHKEGVEILHQYKINAHFVESLEEATKKIVPLSSNL